MKKVFLCHASKDKSFVRRLARSLEARGVSVWLDEQEIKVGRSLRTAIETAIETVDFVVVVLSNAALSRPWVQRELSAALTLEIEKRRELIFPFLKEKVQRLPLFLRDKKYADASKGYAHAVGELLRAVEPELAGLQRAFETIRGKIVLDILRRDGSLVRFTKRSRHRCLEDGIDSFVETLNADGTISNISTKPGTIDSVWVESSTTYVRTLLPKILRNNETVEKTLSCLMKDSFIGDYHTWVVRQHYVTSGYEVIVRFPRSRTAKSWGVYERRGADRFDVEDGLSRISSGGKPAIRFSIRNPHLLSLYVLWWRW